MTLKYRPFEFGIANSKHSTNWATSSTKTSTYKGWMGGGQRPMSGVSLYDPTRLTGQWAARILFSLHLQCLTQGACHALCLAFAWALARQLRSLRVHGKHFTEWAISKAPRTSLFILCSFYASRILSYSHITFSKFVCVCMCICIWL